MFANLSWWSRSGKKPKPSSISTGELETLKFYSVNDQVKMRSASRRNKRKWHSREEQKIDREFDVVLIPSDGGCLSGSESDNSDWSIGWMEPHAPGFQTNEDANSSFAVLIPCYGHSSKGCANSSKDQFSGAIVNFAAVYSAKSQGFLEQWLSSLENS